MIINKSNIHRLKIKDVFKCQDRYYKIIGIQESLFFVKNVISNYTFSVTDKVITNDSTRFLFELELLFIDA